MVDLSSDTQTRPVTTMRAAIARAEVGDEQKGEDPTVNALQERVAGLLGSGALRSRPSRHARRWSPSPPRGLLRCVAVPDRVIPQRDLRNNVGEILRAAEGGETFTVTVRGRPVARVVPLDGHPGPRVDVPAAEVDALLRRHEPDQEWLWELRDAEEPV